MSNTTDLVSLISLLNQQSELNGKLKHLKEIAEYIPSVPIKTVNKDLCQSILPSLKSVFEEILANNCSLIEHGISNESLLNKVWNYLKMCADVLDIIGEILKYIIKNGVVDLTIVGNVPTEVARIIFAVFEHCKKCDHLCQSYVGNIDELYSLFRKAQEIHFMFLKVLEFHTDISFFSEFEIVLLMEVLDVLCNISHVLFKMNTKSMICNWKVYNILIQKYFDELRNHSYDPTSALEIIFMEIEEKLKTVDDMEPENSEKIKQSLKVASFLSSIFVKVSEAFYKSSIKIVYFVINFLIMLYSYKIAFAQHKEYSDLFILIDPFVEKLLENSIFLSSLSVIEGKNAKMNDAPLGFLILCNVIFQKLFLRAGYCNINFLKLLDSIFNALDKCFEEFLNELEIVEIEERNIYEELLVNVTSCSFAFTDNFTSFECVLLKNVLSGSIFKSLFAIDVWDLFLRNCHPKLRYQTMCNLVELCEPLFSINYDQQVEVCFLKNLLQRIFCLLSVEDKIDIIAKYKHKQSIFSKAVSFEQFTVSQRHLIESLIYEAFEGIELFESQDITVNDFFSWSNNIDVISTVNFTSLAINVTNFTNSLSKSWNFDKNGIEVTNTLLNTFIKSLYKITNVLILHFDNSQLLSVLIEIKELLQNTQANIFFALNCLQFLNKLSKRSVEFSQEYHQIATTIADIFVIILNNEHSLIKTDGINTLECFENSYHYNEVIEKVRCTTKVMNVNREYNVQQLKQYYKNLKISKYKHHCCTNESVAPVTKKFKYDNDEINIVVERIKNDVAYLVKIGNCNLSSKTLEDIAFIVSNLRKLQ